VTDPRFLRWLAVTEEALSGPTEHRGEAVLKAYDQREELRRSLTEDPPHGSPDPDTARRLRDAEAALAEAAAAERDRVDAALREVRLQKRGTVGYKPVRSRNPVFVSRKA
jgi:hypothetical protein